MLQTSSGFLGEPGETAKQGRRLPQFSPAMTPNCKHTQENHLPKLTHVVSAPVCRVSPSSLKKISPPRSVVRCQLPRPRTLYVGKRNRAASPHTLLSELAVLEACELGLFVEDPSESAHASTHAPILGTSLLGIHSP